MKTVRVSDVVPVAKFRSQTKAYLKHLVDTDQPVMLTQNGVPAAIMVSPAEYDRMVEQDEQRVLAAIRAGEADLKAGRVLSEKQALRRLGLTPGKRARRK